VHLHGAHHYLSFMSDNDAQRRSRLLSVKLAALIGQHLGIDAASYTQEPCGLGAALVCDDAVWILVDGDASHALGPAIAWASKYSRPFHLVVDNHSGVLVRRASGFELPISVWHVEGNGLLPAIAEPHQELVRASDSHSALISQIDTAGAESLVEWGVVVGEVRGLEICRVVDDEHTNEARIEVGIGAHDRETYALVHQARPIHESIADVVATVGVHRVEGAPFHPYNHIAPERFARWRALQEPAALGFLSLTRIDPPVRRTNVKDSVPCVALGKKTDGTTTAVVFVHGIDLDVVTFSVDAALQYSCESVMIVARPQDVVASLRTMASATVMTTTFLSLDER
jgi:hypothetical protein